MGEDFMQDDQLTFAKSAVKQAGFWAYLTGYTKEYFHRLKKYEPENRAIFLLLFFSMLNIATSVIAVFAIGIYLISRRDVAADIFRTGNNRVLFFFLALSTVVSLFCLNFVGVLACAFVFFLFVEMLYFMQNITRRFYEDFVTLYLGYSIFATVFAVAEYLVGRLSDPEYRCSSTFANPLYYSFFITFAVLFCAYRITSVSRYRRIYVPVLIINIIAMILSGSRMPWVGMFIGLFIILLLRRKYKLIFIFGGFIALLLLLFFVFPDINFFAGLRLNKIDVSYEGRKPYWDMAIRGIFDKPFFGHGMIGMLNDSMKADADFLQRFFDFGSLDEWFMNMKHHGWKMHAHNIILDSLYSYGIIGSLLLLWFILKKGLTFFRNCGYTAQNQYFAMLCGIVASIGINGMVDCEIIGLQTVVFTLLIFAVTGLYAGDNGADKLYKLEPGGYMQQ